MESEKMRIYLTEEMIATAKAENEAFQEQKTYDNEIAGGGTREEKKDWAWIGALGEIALAEKFAAWGVENCERIPYVKTDTKQPDFIIDGVTFDVKTTRAEGLNIRPGKGPNYKNLHDVYVALETSWTLKNEEEALLPENHPYVEIVGFQVKGLIKWMLNGNEVPDVWADVGRPMWKGNRPYESRSSRVWSKVYVFPQCLLIQEQLLRMALTDNKARGHQRFARILRKGNKA